MVTVAWFSIHLHLAGADTTVAPWRAEVHTAVAAWRAVSVFKPLDLHGMYPQQGRRWGSP
jgi:hypothetical protein